MKYLHAENAGAPIEGVRFQPYNIFAGTVVGILATDDEALATSLLKHKNVKEITEAEYNKLSKKKVPSLTASPVSPQSQSQPKAKSAAPVANHDSAPESPVTPSTPIAETVDSVIETMSVIPPSTITDTPATERKSKRNK
jgi:hypothetical protein